MMPMAIQPIQESEQPNLPNVIVETPDHDFTEIKQDINQLKSQSQNFQHQINDIKSYVQKLNDKIEKKEENNNNNIQQTKNEIKINKKNDVTTIENDNSKLGFKPIKPALIKPSLGSAFQLIPQNEIIMPFISISNDIISDTPSSPTSIILKDIHNNNVIYETDAGIIHGNPLLIDKCINVLTSDHEVNILNSISYYHNQFVPWFWSRESIGSVLQNQKYKSISNVLTSNTFDNDTNAIYIKIYNSATDIIENTLLTSKNKLKNIQYAPNTRIKSKCGFAFVQNPITRFIAGYYSVNALLWREFSRTDYFPDLFSELTFYKVINNFRGRLSAFLSDLKKYHYIFVNLYPWMNILSTQTHQLSITQNDINHIFKYEYMEQEYDNILSDPRNVFCIDESDNFQFDNSLTDDDWISYLFNYGINKNDLMDREFRQWIGLPIELTDDITYTDIDDIERMDILYMYDAMDYEIYSKIVEYYWQDFVCFDYDAHYKHDVLDYLIKYQDHFPGFPVKNRTKTNWDRILEFYYSKQTNKRNPNVVRT